MTQCEWCESPSSIELYGDELRSSVKGMVIFVRRKFCCDKHLEKTRELMRLDGFNGWVESIKQQTWRIDSMTQKFVSAKIPASGKEGEE